LGNDVIKAHWENPEKNKPNYLIRDDYWKSRNIEKIPYRRGALFAFWLDNQILKKSGYTKLLDDLMQDLLKRCTTGDQQFSDELFLSLAQQYPNRDITYFFQKHVISGVDFEFTNEDLIGGFKIDKSASVPKLTADQDLTGKYIKL
jgi:predicted metalloprotease with PDZ domain